MELLFDNKETKEEILLRAKKFPPIILKENTSYLFHGDNFEIMSGLLNGKKGFIDLIYIDLSSYTKLRYSITVISGYTGGCSGKKPISFFALIGSSSIFISLTYAPPEVVER